MPISINGTGTITGISAGGLPDDCITTADIAASAVTTAKVNAAAITAAKLDGAQSGSAPIFGARAWVAFDATRNASGAADASATNRFIYSSGNVSSVSRTTTGTHTVNFSTPFPNTNYAFLFSAHHASGVAINIGNSAHTVSSSSLGVFTFYTYTAASYYDAAYVCVLIFA
jgi:hypothetical protein